MVAKVAVDAVPVKAPTNVVDVTEVKPARVVEVPPNDVEVEPIVIALLVKEPFPILLNVLFFKKFSIHFWNKFN